MQSRDRNHAISLGIRISILFLTAVMAVCVTAYYVLSQNFHGLLRSYTIQLVQALAEQGVKIVESELEMERQKISFFADSFPVPATEDEAVRFPQLWGDQLRTLYVSATGTTASDGRRRDIRESPDVRAALAGKVALHGPYFNEEREFVIRYSAPVRRQGNIVGVASVEKDGYRFCELIKNIRFVDTGESYIINAEGTDIAVSDPNHIEWVTSQYNSQRIFAEQGDPTTKSILDLELKGLAGEAGVGTYYWNDGLVHVIYLPIPSVHWVLLAGMREEELASMTQSTLFATLSKGPTLLICLALLLALTGLITFWIVSSLKKNAEINEKLEIIANHDSLTGLLNRRFLESSLAQLWKFPIKIPSQAAVFMMDIDNFKNYNDLHGHPQGDECLRRVSGVFQRIFEHADGNVLRYGGEEFVATTFMVDHHDARELGEKICRLVERENMPDGRGGVVTVSVGVCHVETTLDASLHDCIQMADKALYQAKKDGKNKSVIVEVRKDRAPSGAVPEREKQA